MVQNKILFKRFLICSSGGPLVKWSKTIYKILKEGIMGNIHVKSYIILIIGSGGDVIERHFLSRVLAAPFFSGLEPFVQFGHFHQK